MKKLFTIMIVLASTSTMSQVFVTIETLNFGSGIRIHKEFKNIGIYGGITKSEARSEKVKFNFQKCVGGLSYRINENVNLLAGYCHNKFDKHLDIDDKINKSKMHEHSFDIGFIGKITKKFYFIALTDPINWHSDLGFGFKF